MGRHLILVDSVTRLGHNVSTLVITGSHGAVYAAYVAASRGATAIIFNDAGGGRDDAGYSGLAWLDDLGIAAATVGHDTARIGDAVDTLRRGVITHVNHAGTVLGCTVGAPSAVAARLFEGAEPLNRDVPPIRESRHLVREGQPGIWALDFSLTGAPVGHWSDSRDRFARRAAGGHAKEALHVDALAAVYNDAGMGIDAAGVGRLAALNGRGIAAATVYHLSARIGDGMSTYNDGVVSAMNNVAIDVGASIGMRVPEFCVAVADAAIRAKGDVLGARDAD